MAESAARRVRVDGVPFDVPVRAFGSRMAPVDRQTSELFAATHGAAITRAAGSLGADTQAASPRANAG
jgi:hypothetical protein